MLKDLFQNGWSFDAENFINKMLYRKPHKRLGNEGINEIKEHIWFKNIILDMYNYHSKTLQYVYDSDSDFHKCYYFF